MKNMKKRLYIASISENAAELAGEYGTGLEMDHYCTAENMEAPLFERVHKEALEDIRTASSGRNEGGQGGLPLLFHAPFNELYPAAIDPKIKEVAYRRYEQAYHLAAETYGAGKMIVHSGYMPHVYYKVWHCEKSVEFWQNYMKDKPTDFTICIENVLEDEPYMMAEIAERLGQKNIGLCLDTGHANCMSDIPVAEWVRIMGPYITHVHLHNNDGRSDEHNRLDCGTLNMAEILESIERWCADTTTVTIESLNGRESLRWLEKEGYFR